MITLLDFRPSRYYYLSIKYRFQRGNKGKIIQLPQSYYKCKN